MRQTKHKILRNVKMIISDVDGVWTDGGMYYSNTGMELKKFNVYDGGAIIFLKKANIPIIILTGEKNKILENRFLKLKIEDIRLGIKNKLSELEKIVDSYSIKKENILFIGDFINDYLIMKEVGIPVCPLNACKEIKNISKLILHKKGGKGVLWELTKRILKSKKKYEKVFIQFLECLKEQS